MTDLILFSLKTHIFGRNSFDNHIIIMVKYLVCKKSGLTHEHQIKKISSFGSCAHDEVTYESDLVDVV